ncbi:MAG: potassium-transporting ATPase subunit KdpA [Steroidobacteraceae bacterium]|nr:potassium-transporting ATPase subunit KdpA [Steroidobacteraceae bacterium]MBP9128980.1 potassium-transporting ATPase subunit KdpA [Steroidobacteraceae bacterium]
MTGQGLLQLALYVVVLVALVKPLGAYMAAVFRGERTFLSPLLGPVERLIYRISGVDPAHESDWTRYAFDALLVNLLGFIAVYALQRLQGVLPLNPQGLGAISPDSSFNTAVSFATNTNWQGYVGEATLSYLTQMLGLAVQNFLSAATGIAVLIALIRGFVRREAGQIGNFWVDFTRSTLHVLLPLSFILAVVLASQGVVQSFAPYQQVTLVEPVVMQEQTVTEQTLPLGPAASQVAIKQLGTNGGGFFNVNSAHPFENPTPLSNFLEMLAILLIPAALCYTFGRMVNDQRQGWALLAAMLVIFVPLLVGAFAAEQAGNPRFDALGVDQAASAMQPGGNMEGKETRFGIANSALWATATTAASNGSVNSMHDSFTPLGGLAPMWLMQLGEVVFGGVGSGLYGMLMFAVIAVFIAGLMVGRTPEYLGKKIEAYEVKMAAIVLLVPCLAVLLGTAVAVMVPAATASVANPGTHGFSEILYAFSSAGNNNGSAFAGLAANTPFYNFALGIAMWVSRYWLMIPVLAIAGSLAAKRATAITAGTLPTHTPLFVALLVTTVLLVGALTFLPALALGPIVEHLQLHGSH